MKLYSTLSRSKEDVTAKPVGLYACGPTVYDYTHLGHLRKYTMDDVLIRTLRHAGFEVNHVMNITDVGHLTSDQDEGEDKLEKGARKYNLNVWDVAHKFEDFFFYSMDQMNVTRPNVACRATEHIDQQLELVKELEAKGFTYVIPDDGVYFDTSKLDDYGKLANLQIEQLKEGARVEQVAGKRNITDFALWKFERPGENRQMSWPSPWNDKSFPGWHIECSAMSMHYLGNQFEIHTGGIDHIPVHHTNEIAQAEAATGQKPFVKIWVHHNFLQVENQKMSKSLGNFFTIDDVVERGFEPMALRLLFLGAHYRSELNFTWDNLAGANKALQKLKAVVATAVENGLQLDQIKEDKFKNNHYYQQFFGFLEDDIDTPRAVAVMWEMLKDHDLSSLEKAELLIIFDRVLGLKLATVGKPNEQAKTEIVIPENVENLLAEREIARQNKDWAKADQLRDQLAELGFVVMDTGKGQAVKPVLDTTK